MTSWLRTDAICRVLTLIVGCGVFAALLSYPIPRQIGLSTRYDFSIIFLICLAGIFFTFRKNNFISIILGFTFTLALFALPLSGLWNSGQSEQYLLGGLLPFSDARGYYLDARSLIEGGLFFTTHARRPLFSAFLSPLLMFLGNNLQLTLAVMVLIAALCCYLASRELQFHFGPFAAALFLTLLFFFFRPISGKALSENLGFDLGCLGFVALLFGTRNKKLSAVLIGVFLTTLALNARAGALLMIPALVLWCGWLFRKGRELSVFPFAAAVIVVVLAFAANLFIYRQFAATKAPPFSNFSTTFYGLAVGGKGWQQILTDHPEVSGLPEPQATERIISLALEVIRRKPSNLLLGAARSWAQFFDPKDDYSLFNWFGGDQPILALVSRLGLYVLCLMGLWAFFSKKRDPILALLVISAIGILLSVPFAPPLDANRMRVYAASMPLLLALPAAGLAKLTTSFRLGFLTAQDPFEPHLGKTLFIAVSLVAVTLIGPFIVQASTHHFVASTIKCDPGQIPFQVRISRGSFLTILPQDEINQDFVPNLRINYFTRYAHNLPNWELHRLFDNMKPGKTILQELNLVDRQIVLMIFDQNLFPTTLGLVEGCGFYDPNRVVSDFDVFYADTLQSAAVSGR